MSADLLVTCSRCNEQKPRSQFQYGRKGYKYEYQFSYCNECRHKQIRRNLNSDVGKNLSDRFARLRRRAAASGIPFSISKEEFIAQYHRQGGKCFYSDAEMPWQYGSGKDRNSLSVDKIVPELGYAPGNTVFAAYRINQVKLNLTLEEIRAWMPGWYARIEVVLDIPRAIHNRDDRQ